MGFEQATNNKTVGEKEWHEVRSGISSAETISNLYTEPDDVIEIVPGSNLVELKADFASASDTATITVLRSIVPVVAGVDPEWEKIGTVNLSASAEKSNATYYGTAEVDYVDFRGGDRLAFFATSLSGTISKLFARFVS